MKLKLEDYILYNYIYLLLYCHHQNDSCIKLGCDESHFNVSLIVRDNLKSQDGVHRPQLLKRKESRSGFKQVPLLTSLMPYH